MRNVHKKFSPWFLTDAYYMQKRFFRSFASYLCIVGFSTTRLLSNVLAVHKNTSGRAHRLVTFFYGKVLAKTEKFNSSQIQKLQWFRLQKVLSAAEATPWWQEFMSKSEIKFSEIASMEDFGHLPTVNRQLFKEAERSDLLSDASLEAQMVFTRTSGTTGTPFEWGYPLVTHLSETTSYFYRILSWYGISRKSGGPFIASFVSAGHAVPSIYFFWNPSEKEAEKRLLRIIAKIEQAKLEILYIYPADLFIFAKILSKLGKKVPIRLIITTGQAFELHQRMYIEKQFGCRTVSVYGSREFGPIAVECPSQHDTYHIHAERVLVEITDKCGQPLPKGIEGSITITSLENPAMPLLRYRIGDQGKIPAEPCKCGRTLPLIEFSGRNSEVIKLPSGTKVPVLTVINLFILLNFFEQIEHYQIAQTSLDTLVMKIKMKRALEIGFENMVIEKLTELTNNEIAITIEFTDNLPILHNGKAKMFVPLP